MIVYLSGITKETDIRKVNRLKIDLLSLGCTVISPEVMQLNKLNWSENLRLRMSFLQSCRAIYMLPDWKESIVARIELTVAMNYKKALCFCPEDISGLLTTLDG